MTMQQYPSQVPEPDRGIWDDFLPKLATGAQAVINAPVIGPALRGLGKGIEFVHEDIVSPAVSQATQYWPVGWEVEATPPEDFGIAPWNEAWWRLRQGSPTLNLDPFTEFQTDPRTGEQVRKFVPEALAHGLISNITPFGAFQAWTQGVTGTPGTVREMKINDAVALQEKELGRPVTNKERREIGEDLYKLPPFMRGTTEELPYLAIPTFTAMSGGLKGVRTSQKLANLVNKNPMLARTLSGAIQGVEAPLRVGAAGERFLEKTIAAPFKLAGKGIGKGLLPMKRRTAERWLRPMAHDQNLEIAQKRIGPMKSLVTLNQFVADHLNVEKLDYYVLTTPKTGTPKITRNLEVKLPPELRVDISDITNPNFNRIYDTTMRVPRETLDDGLLMAERKYPRIFPGDSALLTQRQIYLPHRWADDIPSVGSRPFDPTDITQEQLVQARQYSREWDIISATDVKEQARKDFIAESREYPNKLETVKDITSIETLDDPDFMRSFNQRWSNFNPDNPDVRDQMWTAYQKNRHEWFGREYGAEAGQDYADEINRLILKGGEALEQQTMFPINELRRPIRRDGVVISEPDVVLNEGIDLATEIRPTRYGASTVPDRKEIARTQAMRETQDATYEPYAYPTRSEMSQILDTPDAGLTRLHADISELHRSGVLAKEFVINPEEVIDRVTSMAGVSADQYARLQYKFHDSLKAIRSLQDNNWKSLDPVALFRHGSKRDLAASVLLSGGAPVRGMNFYENFMKNVIYPLLRNADNPSGVELHHIEMYLQGKHWDIVQKVILERKGNLREMPDIIHPVTKAKISSRELLDEGHENYWETLIKREIEEYGGDPSLGLAKAKLGAEKTRDLYAEMREELHLDGFISREQRDEMARDFEWYNPIDYVEYAEGAKTPGDRSGRIVADSQGTSTAYLTDGIYELSTAPDIMTAMPPLGEVLARRLISHQLRIHRNKTNKAFIYNADLGNLGIRDVTGLIRKERYNGKRKVQYQGREIEIDDFKPFDIYNKDLESGFITVWQNGERRYFGRVNTEGKPMPVDKLWWEALNGRAGLGVRGGMEVENIFATANSYFKGTYTTFDPLFMIGNGFIDTFTVALRHRILPTAVWWRLARSIDRSIRAGAGEDRFKELMQMAGGYQSRIYDAESVSRQIQREISRSGNVGMVIDSRDSRKLADAVAEGASKYFPIAKIGEYVEQAPRLLVGEKTFKRLVGMKEWKRLMGKDMSRDQWEHELFRNWRGTGKGLMDSPEARHAAVNGLEATINFRRGGDLIRRWNNYLMFLNASFEGTKLPFRMMGVKLERETIPIANPEIGGPQLRYGSWNIGMGKTGGMTDKYDFPLGPSVLGKIRDPRKAASITVASAMSAYAGLHVAHNFQHEEYWDIPTYIRYNSIIMMQSPEKDEDGVVIIDPSTGRPTPNYITIPHRLREFALFFGGITHILERGFTENPADFMLWAKNVWKSSSPVNDVPIPELANVGLEQAFGIDMYRQEPIVNPDYAHLPPEEQYNQYTSEASRIIAERLGGSEWLPDEFKSPMRLEHMYDSAFGGAGKRIKDINDYLLNMFEAFRKNEDKPMAAKVAEYRKLNRTGKNEMLASFTPSEREHFDREVRKPPKPEGSIIEHILAATGIEARFAPDRGGGKREISTLFAERAIPGVTREDTARASVQLRNVKRDVFILQQKNDGLLDAFVDKTGRGLSPEEWRDERKGKWNLLEGAEMLTKYAFPEAAQGKDEATKNAWYNAIYTAAGLMPDYRASGDLLLMGYYNIASPEDDPSRTWNEYYDDRDAYVEFIRNKSAEEVDPTIFDEFSRSLQSNMTQWEKNYNDDMKHLSNYWDIGINLDHLAGLGFTAEHPTLALLWQRYLDADTGTKAFMRDSNKQIDTLVGMRTKRRKQIIELDAVEQGYPKMDVILSFWFSYHNPVTEMGKFVQEQLYGAAGIMNMDTVREAVLVD